jgi:hypothetical protein
LDLHRPTCLLTSCLKRSILWVRSVESKDIKKAVHMVQHASEKTWRDASFVRRSGTIF